ncbi:DUF397 domain-containing protein [Streptomyces echinatus]|uniref:DUF397 domain-containing protein n=1 Tax=Streptomyces echinatus TaxID=67293 RepID=UPI00378B568C
MGHEGQPLWRRSSMCGNENECLEVAVLEDRVFARDSKKPHGAHLCFTASAWSDFLHAVGHAGSPGSLRPHRAIGNR